MAKIEEWDPEQPGTGIYLYFCPACGHDHAVYTKYPNDKGAQWKWNGSLDKPTFSPSCDSITLNFKHIIVHRCHHYVIDGNIRYLADCSHKLAGQTVPMIDRK